jgi:hypothetical protein
MTATATWRRRRYQSGEYQYVSARNAKGGRVCYAVTGEYRAPLKGEFYLSAGVGRRVIPAAYRAPNDLTTSYHICREVPDRRKGGDRRKGDR